MFTLLVGLNGPSDHWASWSNTFAGAFLVVLELLLTPRPITPIDKDDHDPPEHP